MRQLAVRARRQVEESRPRFVASEERREALAESFFAAVGEGDIASLERLLAADVELHGDGGGKAPALARPLSGRSRVARTLVAWSRAGERIGGIAFERAELNGQPGAIARDSQGRVISALVLDVGPDAITAVRSIVNPEKLGHLGPVANLGELLAQMRRRD